MEKQIEKDIMKLKTIWLMECELRIILTLRSCLQFIHLTNIFLINELKSHLNEYYNLKSKL